MEIIPQIFIAKVMHKRFFPAVNVFNYGVYYLALPLSQLTDPIMTKHLAINQFGLLSFYEKDHGNRDGNIDVWVRERLSEHGLSDITSEIVLLSMPRVFGYVFNPISFWFCLDQEKNLRAVLCEVNNTFGEAHYYLCAHKNQNIMGSDDCFSTEKLFHVSPFLKRAGRYTFRFVLKATKLSILIDFYDTHNKKQLMTSLMGVLHPLTKNTLRMALLTHPFLTIKTIVLIHWQALKLMIKGVKYIPKPKQLKKKLSTALCQSKI